jgi:uncharacterized protein
MMFQQHARVQTGEPARFMKQLCRHFGHKIPAEFDDEHGSIVFSDGRCDLSVEPGTLVLVTTSESVAGAAHVADVMASHLTRFGFRENLSVAFAPVA